MLTLAAADTIAGVASSATTVTCTLSGMELSDAGIEVYKVLDQEQLPNAAATIYTVPGTTTAFVKAITLVNTNVAVAQTVQLFRGGTAQANAITPIMTIPAGGMAVYVDGAGWSMYDGLGRRLASLQTPPLSAVLTADSATQTSTTGAIVGPVLTIPAGYCKPGMLFDFELGFSTAQGATANTTPGHFFELRWGGLAGVVIATVGTVTPATTLAAAAGRLSGELVIRTIGATGTAKAAMSIDNPRGTRIAAGDMSGKAGISAAGAGVVIDTTIAKDLVIVSDNQVADASALTFGVTGHITERA